MLTDNTARPKSRLSAIKGRARDTESLPRCGNLGSATRSKYSKERWQAAANSQIAPESPQGIIAKRKIRVSQRTEYVVAMGIKQGRSPDNERRYWFIRPQPKTLT